MLPETDHHCLDHGLGTAVAEEAAAVPAWEAAGAAAVAGGARQAVADAGLAAVAACLVVNCPLFPAYQKHCLCHL